MSESEVGIAGLLALGQNADWADELRRAVAAIDPSLLPLSATHPYSDLIREGLASAGALLARIDEPAPGCTPLDAVDGLCQILVDVDDAPPELITSLRERLAAATQAEAKGIYARALAIARDPELLGQQVELLASEDPDLVAAAARLLGLGRFAPAVPALCGLVAPDRFVESAAAIWALGEIRDPRATTQLEQALADRFRARDCLIALGKIRSLGSLPFVLPYLDDSAGPTRDAAYAALANLLDGLGDDDAARAALAGQLLGSVRQRLAEEPSLRARFFGLLCLARLGATLERFQIRALLGSSIDDQGLSAVSSFYHRQWRKK